MAQSNVPNCIALLDDAAWKLKQALRCAATRPHIDLAVVNYLSAALEQVTKVQASDCFKPPLSDAFPSSLGSDVGKFIKDLADKSLADKSLADKSLPDKNLSRSGY